MKIVLKSLLAAGAVALAIQANAIQVGNDLIDRAYATDSANNAFVIDFAVGQAGTLQSVLTYGEARGVGLSFHAFVLQYLGQDQYQVAFDTGALTVTGTGVNTFSVTPFTLAATDVIAHYGQGISLDIGGGTSQTYWPATLPNIGDVITLPGTWSSDRTYSIAIDLLQAGGPTNNVPEGGMTVLLLGLGMITLGGFRKLAK